MITFMKNKILFFKIYAKSEFFPYKFYFILLILQVWYFDEIEIEKYQNLSLLKKPQMASSWQV